MWQVCIWLSSIFPRNLNIGIANLIFSQKQICSQGTSNVDTSGWWLLWHRNFSLPSSQGWEPFATLHYQGYASYWIRTSSSAQKKLYGWLKGCFIYLICLIQEDYCNCHQKSRCMSWRMIWTQQKTSCYCTGHCSIPEGQSGYQHLKICWRLCLGNTNSYINTCGVELYLYSTDLQITT